MKFVEFLNEAEEDVKAELVKGVRSSKLNKKGETSLKYIIKPDDKKLKVYFFRRMQRIYSFVALKTEKIDTGAEAFKFVKYDKPNIGMYTNSKITWIDTDIKFDKEGTVAELLSKFDAKEDRVGISEKAHAYLESTIEDNGEEEPEEELFALGYWSNPYRAGDREYFWFSNDHGDYENKKQMLAAAKRKTERGQPKNFKDYMSGEARVFTSREKFLAAAKKVGINPRIDD